MNLSQNILLTIYKSSIRPNPDYDDILYDKPNNENKMKSEQDIKSTIQ